MSARYIAAIAFAIGACVPARVQAQQLPPQFANAPADVQAIMRRQIRGEKVSAKDSTKAAEYAKQAAISALGAQPGEVQALMNKAMNGQKLTAEERQKLAAAMMQQRGGTAAQMSGLAGQAAAGKAPTKSQMDSLRAAGFAQGRAIASRVDSSMTRCPAPAQDSSFTPVHSRDELMSALRGIAASYGKTLGPAASSALVSHATNAAGVGLWMMGQAKPSVLVLARAALASPTPRTLNNLGAALNTDHDYREARVVLDAANRAAPGSPAVLANLGVAYAGLGQSSAASAQFRSALDAQPALAQARFNLATILKCGGNGGGGGAVTALNEAVAGQSDWFDASEDRDVRLMRAEAGQEVSGPRAESEYTPKRPKLMTFGPPAPVHAPGGDVPKPVLPGSIEEYAKLFMAGKYTGEAKRLSERGAAWHAEATRLRHEYAVRRQKWLAAATAKDTRIPMSHDAALTGLARRRSLMYYQVAQSARMMEDDYAPAGQRLDDAWKRIPAGAHPCPIVGPVASETYGVARAAASAHAQRVDKIMQDYAEDARAWLAVMNDPILIAASLNDIAGDADRAGGELLGEANSLGGNAVITWVLTCSGYKPGQDNAPGKKPQPKQPDPCPMGELPDLNLGFATLKLGCEGAEISIDAGIAIDAKWNVQTRSGSLFVGGGLAVPTGWDDPVTVLGQQATKLAGKVSVAGEAGMLFKFDEGGLTDAGFEFGVSASDGKNSRDYKVDLTVVGGLDLSNDMKAPLDGLASALWDKPGRH